MSIGKANTANISWKQEYIVYRDGWGKLAAQPYQQGMSPRQIAQWCGSANWLSVEATSPGDAVDMMRYDENVSKSKTHEIQRLSLDNY